MDDIHALGDMAKHALEVSLLAALEFVEDPDVEPESKLKAIDQIVRMSRVILSKTLPDLKATHEMHTNTNELVKMLAKALGPEEAKKRLEALSRSLISGPKSAAGRPKEVTIDG